MAEATMSAKDAAYQRVWATKRRADLDRKRAVKALLGVYRFACAGYQLPRDGIHGPSHWGRVLKNGRELVALTPGADLSVVEHFAMLHDCRRETEGIDDYHGARAAAFVNEIRDELILDPSQVELLIEACEGHEEGRVSGDPTIGACWDADLLDLSRLKRKPIAELLSTKAALDPKIQKGAWLRGINREAAGI